MACLRDFSIPDFIEQLDGVFLRRRADGGEVTILPAADVKGHMSRSDCDYRKGVGFGHAQQDSSAPVVLGGVGEHCRNSDAHRRLR
jgi:hypothetical protein